MVHTVKGCVTKICLINVDKKELISNAKFKIKNKIDLVLKNQAYLIESCSSIVCKYK